MITRLRQQTIEALLRYIDQGISLLTSWRVQLSGTDEGAIRRPLVHKDELIAKLRLMVYLRWGISVLVPAILILLASQQIMLAGKRQFTTDIDGLLSYLLSLWPSWILSAVGLLLNGVYGYLIKRNRSIKPMVYAQVWMDLLIYGLTVFNTGGASSPFAFLLAVPVLSAVMLLSLRSGMAAAGTATLMMGIMAGLHLNGVLPTTRYFKELETLLGSRNYLIAMVALDGVLYFLMASSTGALVRTIHRHEQSLAARANEATMMSEVSSILQSTTHLDDVLVRIMDTLLIRLHIDHGLMYLVNDAGEALDLKVERFHPRIKNPPYGGMKVHMDLKREAGLTAICALDKTAFNVTDPANHPLINRELALKLGINPFAVAPMLARGRVVGVVGIDRRFQKTIITQEEAQILAVAGNQAGLTIQNAKLYEQPGGEPATKSA